MHEFPEPFVIQQVHKGLIKEIVGEVEENGKKVLSKVYVLMDAAAVTEAETTGRKNIFLAGEQLDSVRFDYIPQFEEVMAVKRAGKLILKIKHRHTLGRVGRTIIDNCPVWLL